MSYQLILADPPWKYNSRSNPLKTKFRGGAEYHYPTMATKDICNLPVKDMAADNAVLFMWATFPMFEDALKVIEAWGFDYKTIGFLWVKWEPKGDDLLVYEARDQYPLFPIDCSKSTFPSDRSIFFGTGFYTKSNTEACLIATRGQVLKPLKNDVSSVIVAPIREHSKKPYEAHRRIERMYPHIVSRVELFARESRAGWDCWGNEVESTAEMVVTQ